MNYDLITLVAKLRTVNSPEQLEEVKALGESMVRREKNQAILTLMAIGEELGEEEVLSAVEKSREHLTALLEKKAMQ
jgi:hypothetical protein